jgi:hypothetical protein
MRTGGVEWAGTSGQLPTGGGSAAQPTGGGASDGNETFQNHRSEAVGEEERQRLAHAMSAQERAQAEALQAQQAAAAAAGFGSAAALAIAQDAHAKRLAEIVKQARERDIHVNHGELGAMSAEELEDWAQRHV